MFQDYALSSYALSCALLRNIIMWGGTCCWTEDRVTYHRGKVNARKLKLHMTEEQRAQVLSELKRDTDWLAKMNLMDYSLLVGIRKGPPGRSWETVERHAWEGGGTSGADADVGCPASCFRARLRPARRARRLAAWLRALAVMSAGRMVGYPDSSALRLPREGARGAAASRAQAGVTCLLPVGHAVTLSVCQAACPTPDCFAGR